MLYFCTLFDSFYLSRGLVMYNSLKSQTEQFHLYIFAFDDLAYTILSNMSLKNVTLISLEEFESPKLLSVKKYRTKAEYCWTSTPSTIEYVLEKFQVPHCTYIDADLYFYHHPKVLLDELNDKKNVLISEHRYNKIAKMRDEKRAGKFCVQFITFTNDEDSLEVLNRWKNQCIDWCYARYEDGKFGDQKYLDEWPDQYDNVHILQNPGGGVAPWNVNQYQLKKNAKGITGEEKRTGINFTMVFFHFHFVRFMDKNHVDLGWNYLSNFVVKNIYKPYIEELLRIEEHLQEMFPSYQRKFYQNSREGVKEMSKDFFKRLTKYNILNIKKANG